MQIIRGLGFIAMVFIGLSACGGGGGSSGTSDSSDDATSSDSTGTISGTLTMSDAVTMALARPGMAAEKKVANIRVVVDDDETLYDDTDDDGNFTIENVPSGTKCIHASATALDNETYGFRVCDITVGEGDEAEIGEQELTETGAIGGTITLENATDYEGILIYVPGTSFDARTDSDGAFSMTGVPAGDYEIKIEMDGYVSRKVESVIVESGETSSLGVLELLEEASCTDNGAVLAITGIEQSAQSLDAGELATFAIEACTSLDLEIDYEWYLGTCSPGGDDTEERIAMGNELTYTASDADAGTTLTFCGKAYLDDVVVDTVMFYLEVDGNNESDGGDDEVSNDNDDNDNSDDDTGDGDDSGDDTDDSDDDSISAPLAIAYPVTDSTYVVGVPVNSYPPAVTGGGELTYTIDPSLPSGLSFDATTGEISGTPTTVTGDQSYTITTANSLGSVSTTVNIEVVSHLFRVYIQDIPNPGDGTQQLRIYDRDTDTEIESITVSTGSLKEFAIDRTTNKAYFTGYNSGTISVMDLFSNQIVANTSIGSNHIAMDESAGKAYVRTSSGVSRIDLDTLTVEASASFSSGYEVALDSVRGYLYLNDHASNKIGIFYADSLQKITEFTLSSPPIDVVVDEDTGKYFVDYYFSSNTVSIFNSAATVAAASVSIGSGWHEGVMVVDSANDRLFVVNESDKTVSVINTASNALVHTVSLSGTYHSGGAATITLDAEADQVYIGIGDAINVYDIAAQQITEVLDYGTIRPTRIRLWEVGQ